MLFLLDLFHSLVPGSTSLLFLCLLLGQVIVDVSLVDLVDPLVLSLGILLYPLQGFLSILSGAPNFVLYFLQELVLPPLVLLLQLPEVVVQVLILLDPHPDTLLLV